MKIFTLGVYGYDAAGWFGALQTAGVDTLIDVRQRRGVRGAQYAFVNSQQLQQRLAELGIRYLHRRDLAPSPTLRAAQATADKRAKVAKRQRATLDAEFVAAYRADVLEALDPHGLRTALPGDAAVIALFCVEREPAACHRALLADYLQQTLGWSVIHLLPPQG